MDYKDKYNKYKNKYLNLKNKIEVMGGTDSLNDIKEKHKENKKKYDDLVQKIKDNKAEIDEDTKNTIAEIERRNTAATSSSSGTGSKSDGPNKDAVPFVPGVPSSGSSASSSKSDSSSADSSSKKAIRLYADINLDQSQGEDLVLNKPDGLNKDDKITIIGFSKNINVGETNITITKDDIANLIKENNEKVESKKRTENKQVIINDKIQNENIKNLLRLIANSKDTTIDKVQIFKAQS